MPTAILLCGPPGCGKTTFRKQYLQKFVPFSTDDLIMEHAAKLGLTYGDVFEGYFKTAQRRYDETLDEALSWEQNIVIDRTHTTVKSRKRTLAKLPPFAKYKKVVIRFGFDQETLVKRVEERGLLTGQSVPAGVVRQMCSEFTRPKFDEGFDLVTSDTVVEQMLKVMEWK